MRGEPPYFRIVDAPDTLIVRPLDRSVLIEIGRPGPSGEFQLAGAACLTPEEVQGAIDAMRHARRLVRQRQGYHRRAAASMDPTNNHPGRHR